MLLHNHLSYSTASLHSFQSVNISDKTPNVYCTLYVHITRVSFRVVFLQPLASTLPFWITGADIVYRTSRDTPNLGNDGKKGSLPRSNRSKSIDRMSIDLIAWWLFLTPLIVVYFTNEESIGSILYHQEPNEAYVERF